MVLATNRELVEQVVATPRPEVYIDSCPLKGPGETGRVGQVTFPLHPSR